MKNWSLASVLSVLTAVACTSPLPVRGQTGPTLVSASPANGATGVALDSTVSFTFSAAMQAPSDYSQALFWFGTPSELTASSFSYSWSADQKTLTATYSGGFPASDTVTWTLNPASFQDLTGNELSFNAFPPYGQFTTTSSTGGGGNTNNCSSSVNGGITTFSLSESDNYVQGTANAPTPEQSSSAFSFFGGVTLATNRTATDVTLAAPGGAPQPMMSFSSGSYFTVASTNTQAGLDALQPAGDYTFAVSGGTSQTVTATLPANALPTPPHISNFAAAQAINAGADFTLAWDPMVGGRTNDSVSVAILDSSQNVVFEPMKDGCPTELPGTATSILIPGGTLSSNQTYTVNLGFIKLWTADTSSYPGSVVSVVGESQTQATLSTGGGAAPPPQPLLSNLTLNASGAVAFQFTAEPGHNYTVEYNPDLSAAQGWTQLLSTNVVGTSVSVQDNSSGHTRFYRVRAN
jgi:Bacterial Ig-like domain